MNRQRRSSKNGVEAVPTKLNRLWRVGAVAVVAAMLLPLQAYAGLTKNAYSIVEDTPSAEDTEPSIAINPANPNNIVIGWMKDPDGTGSQKVQCWTARSTDGGVTWTNKQRVSTNTSWACYDVSVAYKLDGSALYMGRVEANNGFFTSTIDYLRTSTDNGATWPTEAIVNNSSVSGNVTDRPWVSVNWGAGTFLNSIFMSSMSLFNEPVNSQHVYIRRYGTTPPLVEVDTAPTPDAPKGKCVAWQTHSGHGDKAYMAWRSKRTDCPLDPDLDDGCFALATSSDAGATWLDKTSVFPAAELDFVEYKKPAVGSEEGCATTTINPWEDTFPYPVIAANPSAPSTAVAVWLDSRFSSSSPKDSDVVLLRTTDSGNTWTSPSLVNTRTSPDGNGIFQDRPWAAYNPTGTRLFVLWRDRRHSGTGMGKNTDLYVACSTDNGQTWASPSNLRLSDSGHKTAPDSQMDGFNGVAASGSTGVAVWSTYATAGSTYRDLRFAKFTCD